MNDRHIYFISINDGRGTSVPLLPYRYYEKYIKILSFIVCLLLFCALIFAVNTQSVRFTNIYLNYIIATIIILLPAIGVVYEILRDKTKLFLALYSTLLVFSILFGSCTVIVFTGMRYLIAGSPSEIAVVYKDSYKVRFLESGGCGAASCPVYISLIQEKEILPGVLFTKQIGILDFDASKVTILNAGDSGVPEINANEGDHLVIINNDPNKIETRSYDFGDDRQFSYGIDTYDSNDYKSNEFMLKRNVYFE